MNSRNESRVPTAHYHITIAANDDFPLHAYYHPVANAKAIVVLLHGANEHVMRYQSLFEVLVATGYTVIAADHRGHGRSVTRNYPRGYMESIDEVIDDIVTVVRYVKRQSDGQLVYMIGHSMGSMFARVFLQRHDWLIDKLVLSAPVQYMMPTPMALAAIQPMKAIHGKRGKSSLVTLIGKGGQCDSAWVSKDLMSRRKFKADPLSFNSYYIQGYQVLLSVNRELHHYSAFRCQNSALPILMMSGESDVYNGGARGLKRTRCDLSRCGYHAITNRIYPGFRHEILNDTDNAHIVRDLIEFLA